jgi:HAD superfamily hydrolase (TIGR01509 family)
MNGRDGRWKIRCVIYDCDGVIIDSLDANRRFYNSFRTRLGLPPVTAEELLYAHTHTVHEALHFLFPDPELISKALRLYSLVDPEDSFRQLKLEPDIVPALARIKDRGILRAISTSRTTGMASILSRFGLELYFDLVVTACDVKNPKPDPESVEMILRKFLLSRSETVLVGDSENDLQTALAAGIKFVAYKNTGLAGDAHIENHLEILNLLSGGQYHESAL